jgi:hypothetical protein
VAKAFPEWADGILGDKAHSLTFDNAKIRSVVPEFNPVVPFAQGAREIVDWHDAAGSEAEFDQQLDRRLDSFIAAECAA